MNRGDGARNDGGTSATAWVLCPTVTAAIGRDNKRDPCFEFRLTPKNAKHGHELSTEPTETSTTHVCFAMCTSSRRSLIGQIRRGRGVEIHQEITATNIIFSAHHRSRFPGRHYNLPKKAERCRIFVNSMLPHASVTGKTKSSNTILAYTCFHLPCFFLRQCTKLTRMFTYVNTPCC